MAHPQIAVFARLANGADQPVRMITGQQTLLARTIHDIRYNAVKDEFVIPNQFGQALITFRGDATENAVPVRVINGPKTQLKRPDRLDIDTVHNEIFVPDIDRVLVYDLEAEGDVAPKRVLMGPATRIADTSALTVDPVNNIMVVADRVDGYPSLLIFDRTAEGNTPPLRIIGGPATKIIRINQMEIHPPSGMIVATQPGSGDEQVPPGAYVGIWSIYDDGNVAPRWIIPAGPTFELKKPRGVTLDPENKEIIVADMRRNAVLTYYFPPVFDTRPGN